MFQLCSHHYLYQARLSPCNPSATTGNSRGTRKTVKWNPKVLITIPNRATKSSRWFHILGLCLLHSRDTISARVAIYKLHSGAALASFRTRFGTNGKRTRAGDRPMKKVFLSTVALIAFAAPAAAADLAARPYTKAPPAPIAVVYDWSGFYIGVNGGWGSSHKCWDFVTPAGAFIAAEGCHDATGGTAGGQIGYRWQSSAW